ncbi:MAG: asparaginase [Chloroflexota bacterium]|nr:asparaginase [Chloroflexota bacterium]
MTTVAVVFTGGTISMRPDPNAGGPVPTLDGAAIIARTPGLDEIAQVEAIDWGLVPASHLTFAQLLDIARTVRDVLARDEIGGAVVVQGTDNIEETAFALDLLLDTPKPVVFTGAMRSADDDGYDGPANLRDAVRCAAAPEMRGQGVLVALAGLVLPADDATKTHTDSYAAFQALNLGPLAQVDGGVTAIRRRHRRRLLPRIPDAAAEPVVLLTAVLGMDGTLVRLSRGSGARGLVIAATGVGNTQPSLLEACREQIAEGVPVVLTTRCPSGRARALYGFPGGGVSWERAGAIVAGYLGGPKARVALALGLGAGLDDAALRSLFAE